MKQLPMPPKARTPLFKSRFGLINQRVETVGVMNGKVGQNLAVNFDTGFGQTVHKWAICHGVVSTGANSCIDAPDWYHPGRSGTIRLGPKIILAHFGELHPGVLGKMGVSGAAAGFELFIDNLPVPKRKGNSHTRAALQITDLQPVRRDFAFLVEGDTPAGDVLRAAGSADKKLIEAVNLFDSFEGEALGTGKKSIAIEVTLLPREETLTDKQIDEVASKIIAAVTKATGGEIRG